MTSLYQGTDVIELTDSDFDLTGEPTLKMPERGLVMFYSAQCPHCISKKDDYIALAKKLNKIPGGYRMYSVHVLDPDSAKVGNAMNVQFIPTFFEVNDQGLLVPYAGEFGLEPILKRAKEMQSTQSQISSYPSKGIDIKKIKQIGGAKYNWKKKMRGGAKSPGRGKSIKLCQGVTSSGNLCARCARGKSKYCWQHGG